MHRRILSIAAQIAVGAACVTGALDAPAKSLVYCAEASPEGFDPAVFTSGSTFTASSQTIFNRLVEFEPGTTNVVGSLAQSWTISDDGKTYTLHLRPNVKFQTTEWFTPSRTFNADDVVFTFDRMLNTSNPFDKAAPGNFVYAHDMNLTTEVASVEKVDPLTVKITLTQVDAAFLADLAMDFLSIHSAEYAAALLQAHKTAELNTRPVGTGPFVLRRYDKDSQIRFAAFDGYWKGRAKIDTLVFAIVTDSAVRVQKLKANECQVSSNPKPQELDALKADPALKVLSQNGLNVGYMALNVRHKPLDNLDVRRAINMAIDKKSLIDAVYHGAGVAAVNPIPPTMWSYDKNIKDYPYDPVAARALLAKAGFPNGFDIEVWAPPIQRPYNPDAQKSAELIQADLARIGIRARLVKYEWGEYLKRVNLGQADMPLLGWTGDNGDPDNFLGVLLGCASTAQMWCDKDYDDAIAKARRTTDVAQRTHLYERAQQIFKQQAPWVPLAHSVTYMAMRKNVTGYVMSPLGTIQFYPVDVR